MLDDPPSVVPSARALSSKAPAHLINGHTIARAQARFCQFKRRGKPGWTTADDDDLLAPLAPHETRCPKTVFLG
jgi:hypothetical protein